MRLSTRRDLREKTKKNQTKHYKGGIGGGGVGKARGLVSSHVVSDLHPCNKLAIHLYSLC